MDNAMAATTRVTGRPQGGAGEVALVMAALDRLDELGIPHRKIQWEPQGHGGRLDALVRLGAGRDAIEYGVVATPRPTPTTLGALANQLAAYPGPRLLVADHVTPPMALRLKELGIAFADAVGNAWIDQPGRLVYVTGQRPAGRPREHRAARLFQPGGLKTVFAILCRPDLAAAPLRKLADAATVAHGTAAWVMKDLQAAGYVRHLGKRGRRFVQRRKLLDLWAEAYPQKLKPKLGPRRFLVPDPGWWRRIDHAATGALIGGEHAGAILTDLLQPETLTIYTTRGLAPLVTANVMLPPGHDANVEVVPAFWNFDHPWEHKKLVPPVLVYADLLATGDDRCIETARRVFDDHLADLAREP